MGAVVESRRADEAPAGRMSADPPAHSCSALAKQLGGELRGRGEVTITGVNALDDAREGEITFIADAAHAARWRDSRASAAVVSTDLTLACAEGDERPIIRVPNAEFAMIALLRLFAPPAAEPEFGVHPTAWVDPDAVIGANVRIGPHVSIERGAVVGEDVVLHAGVRIGPEVEVGAASVIHANTVIRERCRIGRRVILHPNVSIGADGFGYRPAPDGSGLLKMPHIGTVEIEDDVEIGAGTCVDRGKFGATTIGTGTKIDNLCQIAHNCRIGRHCVIAGLTGLGGSVVVGDGAVIAGCVAIADHIRIGPGATVGAKSGVMKDIPAGETHLGYPAFPSRETLRQWAALHKLPALLRRLSRRSEGEDG